MRALVQRVTHADVSVSGESVGAIDNGLLVLLGITHDDGDAEKDLLVSKIVNLRIFPDSDGVMNRSLLDLHAEDSSSVGVLVVSQFTLYADVRKGRRPSWTDAARPETAEPMVDAFVDALRQTGITAETGSFGAHMQVSLVNDGPVTIWLDSAELMKPRKGDHSV